MNDPVLHVVKIGGNVLDDPAALSRFLTDFTLLPGPKILVHGGGKLASQMGERLGLSPVYVAGRRITDDATLELVTMVYGGLINRQVTAQLQALGCNAIGLTGADGDILRAAKRPVGSVDYGWAGDLNPQGINSAQILSFLNQGLSPVLAPLTHDGQGHLLNTNADTIAAVLAGALTKFYRVHLMFCFEKKGILANAEDDHSVLRELTKADYLDLQNQAAVYGGILPKLDNAFFAAAQGVKRVVIGQADDLLANTLTDELVGTRIILEGDMQRVEAK